MGWLDDLLDLGGEVLEDTIRTELEEIKPAAEAIAGDLRARAEAAKTRNRQVAENERARREGRAPVYYGEIVVRKP